MEHPFYVTDTEGEVVPIKQLPYVPEGFYGYKDKKTFIGNSCNRSGEADEVNNAIRDFRSEMEKYGYTVVPGYAPEDSLPSGASGMFGGELLG